MKNTKLSFKQLKKIVSESATITESYLIVYVDYSLETERYYKIIIDASSIQKALEEFQYKIGNRGSFEVIKVEKLF